ncbi:MAG: N-acetyl-gamma-glutamyl-phosphate reductase [Rhodospirillaceae bacterium]|nr:N-acetyl-gamma-glutamyl-phosphate reductase [Rhodospirillaceae bacterium]
MAPKVFIDGEAGTTGLQIRQRLEGRRDIELVSIDPAKRKDEGARAELLNAADVVILCLPDDAAKEAVKLITNPKTKVIDASTAHRVADGWVFGFPEMDAGQRAKIAAATRISNPGCYSTGAIALLRPLVNAGVVASNYPVTINAVSGYSGGGKAMIAEFEDKSAPAYTDVPFRLYAFELMHKHVPEIQKWSGLSLRPYFAPSVGRYAQGMLVEIPLHLALLQGGPAIADVHAVLAKHYAGEKFVTVVPLEESAAQKTLPPEQLNGTNRMKLYVFGSDKAGQARLVAQLDNLGKGASGQSVQCLNIALGLPECAGLN